MGEPMKKKLLILLLILASIFLYGCRFKSDTVPEYELTEGAEIRKTLDILSNSILSMDVENYMSCFSPDCSFLPKINADILLLKSQNIRFKSFSMNIEGLKRNGEGIEASVNTQWEATLEGKKKSGSQVRNIYFSEEKGTWKIEDYYFHNYIRPSVIVGSSSLLFSNAESMAETLGSGLYLDTNHLQNSGDIILLGTAYDNASILEIEGANSTYVRVTEDYPGGDLGIVQVIPNVEGYRHVIVIQGSSLQSAKNAIAFMANYFEDHRYMEPGVYFIKENKIRKAELLELTSLTSLNHNKADETLARTQNTIEYNIKLISEEIALEKDNISLLEKNISEEYRKDYNQAFARSASQKDGSQAIDMGIICSYFMDKDICTKAFELPVNGNIDTLYSASMLAKGMDNSAVTALLRLAGLKGDEVFILEGDESPTIFANIEEGYTMDLNMPLIGGINRQYALAELKSIENDGYYMNLKENTSNMLKEDIINSINPINNAYNLGKELLQSKIARRDFSQDEKICSTPLSLNIIDIYEKLQNNTPYYHSPNSYSSINDAKEKLREVMGELLSLKCRKYILNLAGKYPGSQYDYSRYSAGLAFVEYPQAYAESARESEMVKSKASELASANRDRERKIESLLSLLSTIKIQEKAIDYFLQPEKCLESKSGGAIDKALLAYGLYSNLINKSDETWITVGENSSYLVMKDEYGYKYIDCKYNAISRMPDPSIYLCFNEKYVYNARLGIGEKPEFIYTPSTPHFVLAD